VPNADIRPTHYSITSSAAFNRPTAGLRPGVSAKPVTAHEMIPLRCMVSPMLFLTNRAREAAKIYGVSTTRPMILPARKSSITAFTTSSGLVATGTCGSPARRTSAINSAISGTLPT
jgi:hypothetical protein